MTRNYRVVKDTDKFGDDFYSVREVYWDDNNEVKAFSSDAVGIGGYYYTELVEDLKKYQDAFSKPVLTISGNTLVKNGE